MYRGEYDREPRIPEGYSGVMIGNDITESEPTLAPEGKGQGGGILTGLGAGLGRILKLGDGFHLGLEEILIIAAAAFLFFSKDGDRECALMLVALLFIV